ncbi:hypothetical protein PUN28_003863 [Cardiocondyla obscurior]|uniref:Uncharacterized protein n=1 Tax=Cardiocondyla obscurior TaxID=286306 RepID=A0AAW2GNP8_9HYME
MLPCTIHGSEGDSVTLAYLYIKKKFFLIKICDLANRKLRSETSDYLFIALVRFFFHACERIREKMTVTPSAVNARARLGIEDRAQIAISPDEIQNAYDGFIARGYSYFLPIFENNKALGASSLQSAFLESIISSRRDDNYEDNDTRATFLS